MDGIERSLLNEILADSFRAPAEYNALRYDAMGATASERESYDAEYANLLTTMAQGVPERLQVEPGVLSALD